jgi:hypothetical protein
MMKTRNIITTITLVSLIGASAASGEIRQLRDNDEHKVVVVKGEAWQPEGFDDALIIEVPRVAKEPVIDGKADDPVWAHAERFTVPLAYGPVKEATLKAVYTEKEVFLLVSWPDPTRDDQHHPWIWDEKAGRYVEGSQVEDALLVSFEAGCEWTPSLLSGYTYDFDGWHWLAARTNPLGQAVDAYGHTHTVPRPNFVKYTARATNSTWQTKFEYFDPAPALLTAPWQELERLYRFVPMSKDVWVRYGPDNERRPPPFAERIPAPKADPQVKPASQAAHAAPTPPRVVPQFRPVKLTGDAGEVAAKGHWADGRWTVEYRRVLETPGRTAHDVIFSRVTQFSIHVFDHTERVDEVSESGRLWLRFKSAKGSTAEAKK